MAKFWHWHEGENQNPHPNTANQLLTIVNTMWIWSIFLSHSHFFSLTGFERFSISSLPYHSDCLSDDGFGLVNAFDQALCHDDFTLIAFFHFFPLCFLFYACVCCPWGTKCVTMCVLIHRISALYNPTIDSFASLFEMFNMRKKSHAWAELNSGISVFKNTNNR